MSPALSYGVAAFLGFVALLALVALKLPGLDPVVRRFMIAGQGAAAVVVLLDVVTLLQGHEVDSLVTHVGYAVAAVGLPVILLNRRPDLQVPGQEADASTGAADPVEESEPEPAHLAVVAVTAIALLVLVVRLQQTW